MSDQLAIIKKNVIDVVSKKVSQFQKSGEIIFPKDYSPENALKSAWLVLQETVNRDKKPALEVCTQNSIANSLLDMVVQGLNPAKKQCYFIVYGNKLTCQRSYFGSIAVAKMICRAKDVFAQVIWGPDEFEYEIIGGNKKVSRHTQKLSSVGQDPQGAYCTIILEDGSEYTDIMTMDQIKSAWSMSKMNPVNAKGEVKADSTHGKFDEEMIKKTVINRVCKKYINSSSDNAILLDHFNSGDEIRDEIEFEEEVAANASQAVIDVTPEPKPEPEQKNKPEPKKKSQPKKEEEPPEYEEEQIPEDEKGDWENGIDDGPAF